MFNRFFHPVIERLAGRTLSKLLSESSDTSDRTWRDRLKHGWNPTPEQLDAFSKSAEEHAIVVLREDGYWSEKEAHEIIAKLPANITKESLPTADLLYVCSPDRGINYVETISVASQFDRYSNALSNACNAKDLLAARHVLMEASSWLRTFYAAAGNTAEEDLTDERLHAATDLQTLLAQAQPLAESLVFHVLSCWDLEFCSHFFGGTMVAHPLFGLVMPRMAPSISFVAAGDSMRLLRDGRKPDRKVFETSMSRFLDFVAVLIAKKKYRRFPVRTPGLFRNSSASTVWTG